MEYHKTKDILRVMQLLGHKNIKNTLVYTQLVTFQDDEYVCRAAATVKEAKGSLKRVTSTSATWITLSSSENASEYLDVCQKAGDGN